MRPATLLDDPKLARISSALREAFGTRLVSALLFGSRARGDHQPDSDYDVAVFLEDFERNRDRDILDQIRNDLGEEIWTLQFWPFPSDGLAERTTLMFNIRNEGAPLPGLGSPPVVAPSISPDEGPMKPETQHLLEASAREVVKARKMLSVDEPESGARDAYHAALFAARALIFELRNIAPKTHSGTVSLFAETAIKSGLIESRYSGTLTHGLNIRTDVDYAPLPQVTREQAIGYVYVAIDFVQAIRNVLEVRD